MRIWRVFRSAVTGRFVSKQQADANPATTVGETVGVTSLPSPCQMCGADVTTPNEFNYCADCAGE
jgi:hypothetical protein